MTYSNANGEVKRHKNGFIVMNDLPRKDGDGDLMGWMIRLENVLS